MKKDQGKGRDKGMTSAKLSIRTNGIWKDKWIIRKYASQVAYEDKICYEENVLENANALLDVGINRMWQLITGASAEHFDNTTEIGVGDDDTAVDSETDEDLQAETNKTYVTVEDTPTSGSDEKIVAEAVFGGTEANYDWREFVLKQDVCLNRLVSSQGTKADGQVWTVTLEVILS